MAPIWSCETPGVVLATARECCCKGGWFIGTEVLPCWGTADRKFAINSSCSVDCDLVTCAHSKLTILLRSWSLLFWSAARSTAWVGACCGAGCWYAWTDCNSICASCCLGTTAAECCWWWDDMVSDDGICVEKSCIDSMFDCP